MRVTETNQDRALIGVPIEVLKEGFDVLGKKLLTRPELARALHDNELSAAFAWFHGTHQAVTAEIQRRAQEGTA